ncbi:hypothetical protein ACFWXA_34895 [Streptomyces atroolivaceus]|uniref:hypothetical protein n=1 Tax=Streptomyces atroolivaceus TaxID=66869 RepID=UPI00364D77FF
MQGTLTEHARYLYGNEYRPTLKCDGDHMVVVMLLWPAMTWAMWGGRPLRIASVMKM